MSSVGVPAVNATHFQLIPTFRSEKCRDAAIVRAIVETPKGSPHKYAFDADHGIIELKEVLPPGYRWPFDYGFVPQTLGDDGDPLDILVLSEDATFSGCMLATRVLGAIRIRKDGVRNDRFIGAPERMKGREQFTDDFRKLKDVPPPLRGEIESFLIGYSEGEGHKIELDGECDVDEAMSLIEKGRKRFKKSA